ATTRIYSVYFDTPDHALRDAGAALRLRRLRSRWIQTLKRGGRVEAGLHQREEIEMPVPAQLLNYPALRAACGDDLFEDADVLRRIAPVFLTDFKRTTRQLEPVPGTHIEFCLDRGSISAGNRHVEISEVELEFKSGSPMHIIDFALQLVQHVPLRLEATSKAQRGYALIEGRAEAPVKANTLTLLPEMSIEATFRTIVFGCVTQLQSNERGLRESDDPEYLHQARVALRRLRSAFSVFKPAFGDVYFAQTATELRWLGGVLGPARDWDVFTGDSLPQVIAEFSYEPDLRSATAHAARMRDSSRVGVREAIASSRYTTLLLQLIGVFLRAPWTQASDASEQERERPLLEFARRQLERRHKSVRKHGRHLQQLDRAALHQLRIRVKKLRYACEFFGSLFEKKTVRQYSSELARLQSLLGTINDAATAQRLSRVLVRNEHADSLEAVGLLCGWHAAHASGSVARLPQAWKKFTASAVFW
ncbi:MAG: CYTH and CHAD domain-containing protein, partial [Betaproteobacteria bacterium]